MFGSNSKSETVTIKHFSQAKTIFSCINKVTLELPSLSHSLSKSHTFWTQLHSKQYNLYPLCNQRPFALMSDFYVKILDMWYEEVLYT